MFVNNHPATANPPILMPLLALGTAALYGRTEAPFLLSLVLFLNLWVLAVYDWITYRLPNSLTLTLGVTGLVYTASLPPSVWPAHMAGAVIGLAIFPVLNMVYARFRGRDGVGMGDAKLLAGIGLWLGWGLLPFVLLIASATGLIYGLTLRLSQKQPVMTTKIPFGPFLCLGGWCSWLFLY